MVRMALVVPVANGEDVGLVGLVWVNAPGFDVLAKFCFKFRVPLWTAGRHGFFGGEWRDDGCAVSTVCEYARATALF